MIAFREMSGSDVEAGLSLCRAAKWNQLARDWQLFLQLNPKGGRVALWDEEVIGTVTTLRYQQSFSWISMVLVSPEHRRKGIGIQLLHEALNMLHDVETIKLDATATGREVYLKLNFADEYPLSRMQATVNENKLVRSNAHLITEKDLPGIAAFDKGIFGADRIDLIEWLWRGAPQYAYIIRESKQVKGFCLGRNGYNYNHIGPVVADNVDVAIQLVCAALQHCAGEPVIIDIPHNDKRWMDWLTDLGFKEQRSFMRMYRGSNNVKSITTKQFAITGPEFG
jgi:GNAT superfamily N-acetyltransferase